ncbi:MAG: hypothetical protein SOZ55_02480 [Ruminococcus sp.]|nr:hypothetical protein [Ruminococcus sp.]
MKKPILRKPATADIRQNKSINTDISMYDKYFSSDGTKNMDMTAAMKEITSTDCDLTKLTIIFFMAAYFN